MLSIGLAPRDAMTVGRIPCRGGLQRIGDKGCARRSGSVVVLSREAEVVAPLTLRAEGVRASLVRVRTPKTLSP